MVLGIQGPRPHARQQLAETRVAGKIGAQNQSIDKAADQSLDFDPPPIGDRNANANIVLSTMAREQKLECSQKCHIERRAVAPCYGA